VSKVKSGVPVTTRALVQRINRKLSALDGGDPRAEQVRAARGKARETLGEFYLLDVGKNAVKDWHLDLDALGRKLGVLRAWERLDDAKRKSE
jgi:hypothetical protein